MLKWGKGKAGNERGATLALVAGSMVALLGFAALAVDVGFLLDARAQAQRTADAMALAAASAFIDDMPNAETLAAARAADYAARNPVNGVTASFNPATDMQIWLADRKVRVWANFLDERGNPMPTFFAKILGISSVNVNAVAAAEASPADDVGCLTPWAVADMWEDTYSGGDPDKYDYDDADRSDTPTTGDSFDNYCPCTTDADGIIFADPNYVNNGLVCNNYGGPGNACTGFGSPYRNGAANPSKDVGTTLTLKPGNPAQSWSPGWFMAWRPPENMGGADYRENIITCIDEAMFDAGSIVPIDTEQGNMIGPTIQGVEERIGTDPTYWEGGCTSGKACIKGCGSDDCSNYNGPRIITVPLMDPTEVMRNGLTEIQFRGFMKLFLDDPSNNDITGHIIGLGGAEGSGSDNNAAGALPLVIRLVE
ncbi:MAG: Tad domain-containing protein [marine benthic group bacterium]|nr:Tad domain-containing protein [Gemmatimonadota bacterium]